MMKNETGRDGSERQGGSCYHGNHPGVCGSRHRDTQTPMRLVPGGLFITWRGALCKTPGMISFLSLPLHRWHHDKVSLALQGSTQMPLLLEGIQTWVKIFSLRKKTIDCQFCHMLPLSPEEVSDSCKASFPLLTCCQRIEADSLALG